MQNATDQAHAAPRAALNPWLIMALISIPVFIGSLDLTVVSAFLPELVVELQLPFNTALDDAAWIVTGYLLAYTVSLTFMGRVSDLIGRRATYLACLVIFLVGSLLVAVAHQAPSDLLFQFYRRIGQRPDMPYIQLQVIVLARVIQAIGAGALVPVSLALVGDLFPPERRAAALGLVGALDTLGWVLGHLYGGVLVQIMPWQGLFWINIPVTLVALVAVTYALRNVPQQRVKGRFDFIGTALIVGALACLNIGLGSNIEVSGFSGNFEELSPLPAYAAPVLFAGALMFIGFLLVETRVRDPLIKLNMFRRRNLSMAALVNLFVGYCLFIGLVSVPLLVNIRQESAAQLREAALEVGILLSALTIPMAMAAIPGGWLSERIGIRWTVIIGLTASLVGFLIKWQTWTLDIANVTLALNMALIGIGIGLTFSPISTAIINSAYDEERGVASALVIILRLIGMTISVSTLSTFGLYRVTSIASAVQTTTFDTNAMLNVYADATLTVLGEMGFIGAVLCAVALVPAFFLTRTAAPPPRKVE